MNRDPIIDQIVEWVSLHPLIRACLLTSTRAVPGATIDALSDYDIILISGGHSKPPSVAPQLKKIGKRFSP